MRIFLMLAGVLGILGVGAGAFGAHALRERLGPDLINTWDTAVFYHLLHTVALLVVATGVARTDEGGSWLAAAGWLWMVGIVLFSGSLYALSLGGPRFLGPITPIGGTALIFGWACLVVAWAR